MAPPSSWSAPQSNGGLPVTGYVVSITPDTPSARISVNGLDATVTGLLPGHTVAILVAAVNSVGTGPPASSSPVTPPDVPAAPTSVVAQPGDGSATVSWSTPPGDGGRPITGYRVGISPPAPGAAVQVSATLAVITGLTNGTAYTFRVAATNAVGTGPQSNPSAPVTPTAAPSPPTGLAYSANPAAYTVGMAIAPNVPSSGGGAPTGYVASPSLPPGLTLAPATGIITGTPLAAVSGTYHVTARNVAGSRFR